MKPSDRKEQDKPSKDTGTRPGPHGEGNYEASRKYNEGVKDHVQNHDVDKEARDAAPRSDAEAREMKEAEREAASRSKGEDPALKPEAGKPSR